MSNLSRASSKMTAKGGSTIEFTMKNDNPEIIEILIKSNRNTEIKKLIVPTENIIHISELFKNAYKIYKDSD